MIRLTYSNRTEHLARALAERIAERTEPLRAITIVVPNRAMERWVEGQIAQRLGIAANLRFVRLERFVREQLEVRGAGRVIAPEELEGRLLALLLDRGRLGGDELAPVLHYLHAAGEDEDAVDRRAVQLARRLARLFQEYAYSRAAMLEAWSAGGLALAHTAHAATERWQAGLFRAIRAEGDRSLPEALRALRGAPRSDAAVHVFGVSYVARAFQDAIAALGAILDVHLYALNPCQEFWEDALSDAERRRRRSAARTEDDPFALLAENDSALLRALGRPGREHVAMLDEVTGFDAHASFEAPAGETLLARVQRSILARAPVEPGPIDRSIRVLACPSIRRELETVATEIWSLVSRSRSGPDPVRFHEIAVLLHGPDRDRYLPQLEAVFGEAHDLPWSSGDLALAARSRVADCAIRLIELAGSSFSRAEVLEIVAHPLVLARWPEASPARVAGLADRLGVFHGIDARDHARTYLEGTSLVHWDQAVRRLALGAWLGGDPDGSSEPFAHGAASLLPEPIAWTDELATGLGLLVRSLASDARFARGARLLPSEWGAFFAAMLRAYLVPDDPAEESELRRCVAALRELGRRDAGAKVGHRVAAELARAELESLPASRGEPLGGGVVVATLLPMRAIPFRAIFALGLGEGRFPSRDLETGLDLRAAARQPGDVAGDERDRYTFLETLLCAREELVLADVARDEQSGEPREPSSVVLAIDEAVGAPLERTQPPLRRHELALGATDPIAAHALPAVAAEALARAQGAGHRRALADARFPEAALARLREDDPRRALLAMPPIPRRAREPGERGRVTIEQLRRFLECPIQGHASAVLGREGEGADPASVDEPFEAARVERERVLTEVFLAAIGEDDERLRAIYRDRVARSAAHGRWPIGALAELRAEGDHDDLARWRRALAKATPDPAVHRIRFGGAVSASDAARDRPRDPLALTVGGETVELLGATRWLLAGGDAIHATTRSLEGEGERARVETLRQALRAFVDHAVLAAAGIGGASRRAWILDRSDEGPLAIQLTPIRPVVAERWLAGVIDDLRSGPRGLYLPCEAVLRADHLFSRGSSEPSAELARSIEEVRTKSPWQGGSSRFGPVRDAVSHPAPEPAQALAFASRRYGAFFDHLRGWRREP